MRSTPARKSSKNILPIALLGLATACLCLYLERVVLGGIPHGWDALSYHFQARLFAEGRLISPPTPEAGFFEMMHVLEREDGSRYSLYPPGWPALLALAVLAGHDALANAALAGCAVILIWAVGRRCFDSTTALLAAVFAPLSPFFVFMGSSYTSHMATAVLLLVVLWALLRAAEAARMREAYLWSLVAGGSAGMAFLVRPYSAALGTIAVTLIALVTSPRPAAAWTARLATASGAGVSVAALYLLYNLATTGDPFLTGYHVLSPNHDFLGFDGPIRPSVWANILYNGPYTVENLNRETWGWPIPDLLLFLIGLALARRRRVAWAFAAAVALYVLGQCAYFWSDLYYGPRMVFEAFPWIALGSAVGIVSLVRLLTGDSVRRWRRLGAGLAALMLLVSGVSRLYPELVDYYSSDYCGQSPGLVQEIRKRSFDRAVVFLDADSNVEYGALFPLNPPEVTAADVVYARFLPERLATFIEAYPRGEYWVVETTTSLLPGQRNLYPDRYRLDDVRWRRLSVPPGSRPPT